MLESDRFNYQIRIKFMDIREAYLNFFASKGHEIIPSAPLVPNDATLLFAAHDEDYNNAVVLKELLAE